MDERPDFTLRLRTVERGLEIREATDDASQKRFEELECPCAEGDDGDAILDSEDVWAGLAGRRAWCESVIRAIAAKVKKIKDYRPAQCHDILIYSNHLSDDVRRMGGERPEYEELATEARKCTLGWKSEPRLGIISVIDGDTLLYDLVGRCARWKLVEMRPNADFSVKRDTQP